MNPVTDTKIAEVSKEVLDLVPARIATHYGVFPIAEENGILRLAVADNLGREVKEELRIVLGLDLVFEVWERTQIKAAIERFYGVGAGVIEVLTQGKHGTSEDLQFEVIDEDKKEEATIVRLVNELLLDALRLRASDIHLEPFEGAFRVRYRVDGLLREAKVSEKIRHLVPSLLSRVKIMARLDIGEKRLPQDGRIKVKRKGEELDLRVSVLPSSYGEAIVIRILKPLELLDLEELGFDSIMIPHIRTQLRKSHGMILVTGPTGSGKTTTLYACLRALNTIERKVITIEDPVEYKLPGILQMQVHTKIDFTFAKALRSMLRHDPDCLMVGEIRDQETAEIAIRSALTGHLVLSTLHTNDAPSAMTRLVEIGIEPYLIASSLEAVIAQRLVRKRCRPCEQCQGTGFYGRTVVYEMMTLSEGMRDLVVEKAPCSVIRKRAVQDGMISLKVDAEKKVREGITSEEEMNRMVN